jgi:hypothetical protein
MDRDDTTSSVTTTVSTAKTTHPPYGVRLHLMSLSKK